jgi:hypothetical protein
MPSIHTRLRAGAFVALAATLLAACGGGGSGGTPAPAAPNAAPPTASTNSVVVTGAITAFGSVYVNGVRYETGSAAFEVGGRSGTQADLKVGHVVQLKGRRTEAGGNASAERIVRRDAVEGPISAIDATTNRVTVLGQTVLVTAATSFDDSISPANLAGLKVGDAIEVSGLPNASGQIEATRIEKSAAGAGWEVVGRATAVNTTTKKLTINALVVDWSTAALADFATGQPKDGDVVEVKGTALNAAREFVATRLENLGARDMRPDDGGGIEVEGYVTRFVSGTDFDVNGKAVTTTSSTVYERGTAADLKLNARVEAYGTPNSAGVVVATKIEFKRSGNVRVEGLVDAIDAAAGTVRVLGVDIAIDANTRLEDKAASRSQFFRLADLRVGDPVEIRGYESAAGSNRLVATRLEREKALTESSLRGPVRSVAQPQFTILGTTVATTPTTRFERGEDVRITATEFFATTGLVGREVEAEGTWNGTTLTATDVKLEN